MSHVFKRLHQKGVTADVDREKWDTRAEAIYTGTNPVQSAVIDTVRSGRHYVSLRCPRRAGKSFALTSLALWWGEKHPGSRILIISLTLKSTKENFWSGAPGGIFMQNMRYGLGLQYNLTDLVWVHENGSRGRLAGAETRADIEHLRGAAAEADVAIIDEGKSFAPDLLQELYRDVLEPGLMTRNGTMIIAGTPGSIPVGLFYEATSENARTEEEVSKPTCIPYDADITQEPYSKLDKDYINSLWVLHTWTLKDNVAIESKHSQWLRALRNKKKQGWTDDNPTWRREYLGEWVTDATDLVYSWAGVKDTVNATWYPSLKRSKHNPSGLDESEGPWHYVLGIDLGYVDDSALVLCAYSETIRELRHVYDFKSPGMTVDTFFDEVFGVIEKYGRPEAIVADTAGGGSKMLVETLNQRYGLGIEPAKKSEKNDHIELINSDFSAGRVKIIPGSDLAIELSGLQWDLSRDSKAILSRTGRLREDPSCPNHLCDALLYLYRYSYHFWSVPLETGPDKYTPEWWRAFEQGQIDKAVARKGNKGLDPHGFNRMRREDSKRRPWN